MNKGIIEALFPGIVKLVEQGKCPLCEEVVDGADFQDELSVKEFKISGLCQKCQEGIFDTE